METPKIRKFTALVHKTFGEFASFQSYNETGKLELYTHELPDPRPEDLTIELIKGYYEQHDLIAEGDMSIEDLEVKKYEYCEEGVLGADIRNKLSPIRNLLAMLSTMKQYGDVMDREYKELLANQIFDQIKEVGDSVDCLSKLL